MRRPPYSFVSLHHRPRTSHSGHTGLARADDGEALVTSFHANPKDKAVEAKVTDDELRSIATRE